MKIKLFDKATQRSAEFEIDAKYTDEVEIIVDEEQETDAILVIQTDRKYFWDSWKYKKEKK